MNTTALAMDAVREAARLRADYGVGPTDAMCPFTLAEHLGVVTRLVAVSSLEGVYEESTSSIHISSLRPAGRRRYTCAHELGHHMFKHGVCLEQLGDEVMDGWSPKEFVANRFASALLMPKLAITSAFLRRGWSTSGPSAEQVFVIAQEFGVGYTTLIGYLERTLKFLPAPAAKALRKIKLPSIRAQLAGTQVLHDIVVVDKHRGHHAVDLEVGDLLIIPATARFEGRCLGTQSETSVQTLCAVAPGEGAIDLNDGTPARSVRVSQQEFSGLARYRHLEDADED